MKEKRRLLIIFARNPIKGRVKTRLAKHIGEEAALEIYLQLLDSVIQVAKQINVVKEIHYSDGIPPNEGVAGFDHKLQTGKDLGARMEQAFMKGFQAGYEQIVLIGSDLPVLKPEDLRQAFSALDTRDYVLGPALDGGYYLIGMKSLNSKLFENISWGSSAVLGETLKKFNNERPYLLEKRRDLDTYEDLLAFPEFRQYQKL